MTASDSVFAGSIPALYHDHLGPLLFKPYAEDMARRRGGAEAAAHPGNGRRHRHRHRGAGARSAGGGDRRHRSQPGDARCRRRPDRLGPTSTLRQADAQALPFDEPAFDAIVCQFGVMFFPDRVGAYREALPGAGARRHASCSTSGTASSENPVSQLVAETVASLFPGRSAELHSADAVRLSRSGPDRGRSPGGGLHRDLGRKPFGKAAPSPPRASPRSG